MNWKKSTRCGTGACIEVADSLPHVYVRDSKEVDGELLNFSEDAWTSFINNIKENSYS